MDRKIVEYSIVIASGAEVEWLRSMAEQVNESIDNGWQPIGGITEVKGIFCQAMVKYEDEE